MPITYSWKQFAEDLRDAEHFINEVLKTGDSLKTRIEIMLAEMGMKGDILFLGSTSPDRLTTVIDPRTPDARYPADFDIGVILDSPFSEMEELEMHKRLFLQGKTSHKYGRNELSACFEKFPVGIVFMDVEQANRMPPVIYSLTDPALSPEQIQTVRALRLFSMRNGAYGGYTQGLKGIALENIVRDHGDFDMVMKWLSEAVLPYGQQTINVPNPLDGSNLVGRVQSDIWKRIQAAAQIYAQNGQIKATPFTIESWQETHPGQPTFTYRSGNEDADSVYRTAQRFASRSANHVERRNSVKKAETDPFNVLVVPYLESTDVFLSVDLPNEERNKEFSKRFAQRWYSNVDTQCKGV